MSTDRLVDLLPDWQLYLEAARKSPNTVAVYMRAGRDLIEYLGSDVKPGQVSHRQIQRYLADMKDRLNRKNPSKKVSPGYVNQNYRSLLQLFRWLKEVEEEIEETPFAKVQPPGVPEKLVPIIPDDDIRKLLKACEGNNFTARRDTAIVRLLLDTGARRAEIVNLKVEDVAFNPNGIYVVGKGSRPRLIPFGAKTAQALRRYMRMRNQHRLADTTDHLLLGTKGPLAMTGLRSILNKRTEHAGLPHINPHRFRHSLADSWLRHGGNEGDLCQIAGWQSREMLKRYGASAAADRAREAHRRAALGDRF